MGEFDLIQRYFSHHKRQEHHDIVQHIGDDCAVLQLPMPMRLAVTTDTLAVGTHFLADIDAYDLGYKSVAVNLSDLAAMGATPRWVSLALTLPEVNEAWLAQFSRGLFAALDAHDVILIGGDTTKGALSITLTAQGLLPLKQGLFRHRAQTDDLILVSGNLGDSAGGLAQLLNAGDTTDHHVAYLLQRHFSPTPRVALGQALLDYSHCAIDISDGLLADLGHILNQSGKGAHLWVEQLPLSDALLSLYDRVQAEQFALTGGEDYELCFTLPQNKLDAVTKLSRQLGVPCHVIGRITAQPGIQLTANGQAYALPTQPGFNHFSSA